MHDTPNANKQTVCLFGRCNAGKSALFNALTGSNKAIVSPIPGTTTDPVVQSIELLPYGPIVLIDTAGIGDNSALGGERTRKTVAALDRADLALWVTEGDDDKADAAAFLPFRDALQKRATPYLIVKTKSDRHTQPIASDAIAVSIQDALSIERLKQKIATMLEQAGEKEHGLLHGLLAPKSTVVLVIPIDSEAPKGRLILPQSQLIRECMDRDMICVVTTPAVLGNVLAEGKQPDLVVTDAQAFHTVAAIVPPQIPLTAFSILMARQKGDLDTFIRGADAIKTLQNNDKILIAETCAHTTGHEDIGKIKIPSLLRKTTGKTLSFDFCAGRDIPLDLSGYALIIHCGGCMITRKEMTNRMRYAAEANVPMTNYGVVLAACNGILERSTALF